MMRIFISDILYIYYISTYVNFPVEVKNTQQLSAGTTTLNFQVSDVCGNTDSGTLTIIATNIVSILVHLHIVPEMVKFNYVHRHGMFHVNGGGSFVN